MSSSPSVSSAVSTRYAVALIDLAEDKKAVSAVEKDMVQLQTMLAESADFVEFVKSPLIKKNKRQAALDALVKKAKFHKLTKDFLGVLVENQRLMALPQILVSFHEALAARRGEVSVRVDTAQALTAAQKKSLQGTLSKSLGAASVTLQTNIDPSLLGGVIVTAGSKMVDHSVRRKLERLQIAMCKGAKAA